MELVARPGMPFTRRRRLFCQRKEPSPGTPLRVDTFCIVVEKLADKRVDAGPLIDGAYACLAEHLDIHRERQVGHGPSVSVDHGRGVTQERTDAPVFTTGVLPPAEESMRHFIPDVDPKAARAELLRRYLHCYGPSTRANFAAWVGIAVRDTDPYTQMRDRGTIVDEKYHREVWKTIGEPGTVLIDGRIAGTWRPRNSGEPVSSSRIRPAPDDSSTSMISTLVRAGGEPAPRFSVLTIFVINLSNCLYYHRHECPSTRPACH